MNHRLYAQPSFARVEGTWRFHFTGEKTEARLEKWPAQGHTELVAGVVLGHAVCPAGQQITTRPPRHSRRSDLKGQTCAPLGQVPPVCPAPRRNGGADNFLQTRSSCYNHTHTSQGARRASQLIPQASAVAPHHRAGGSEHNSAPLNPWCVRKSHLRRARSAVRGRGLATIG